MPKRLSGADIAIKSGDAQRLCIKHINEILFKAAKTIVAETGRFRVGTRPIGNRKKLQDFAYDEAYKASERIRIVTGKYAETAAKLLGIDATEDMLMKKIAGKDFQIRNSSYCRRFAEDIVKMIVAAAKLGYPQEKMLSAIRTGYKTPFNASVITKAAKKDITTEIPSYGRGIYQSAYQNIARNSRVIIALTYGNALKAYGKKKKAVGFKVKRGSSYLCAICDEEASYIHTMKDQLPPYHINCCCYVEFIYSKKKMKDGRI